MSDETVIWSRAVEEQTSIRLNDGKSIPQVGQGVFLVPPEDAERLVETGIQVGYRAIDTAAFYRNEAGVGRAVRASGETVFVTTKLWNGDQGRDKARAAFERSHKELGLDAIDLYLIHWPVPSQDLYLDSWRTLIELRDEGRVRSIGVSNFTIEHLKRIIGETGVVPVTNQVELHPALQQNELVAFHEENGISTTSWSPLGRGALLDDPLLATIASKHGKTVAQVIIRWHIERGLIVIPKASSEGRLRENLDVFNFRLDDDDMRQIATLDRGTRVGPDPMSM
ncbi:aldo/keto reductase [Sphingomonas sp.]|uniref:aldo/keto reductase n=1 Tax=Sphingomonas sp. TaxID=28214 RepID=UPI0025DFCAF4|nr:aldo/keto reductase [Sphingomonas sp.]MBV9528231.1 aldo/keto reductase [Sphingomonas sp.]